MVFSAIHFHFVTNSNLHLSEYTLTFGFISSFSAVMIQKLILQGGARNCQMAKECKEVRNNLIDKLENKKAS